MWPERIAPRSVPEACPVILPGQAPRGTGATRGTGGSKRAPALAARSGVLATPALRWIGSLPVKGAVLVFAGAVLAGTILTIVMGQEPGFLLGLGLVLGSVAATAAVRRGGAHKFIPLPALAYLVAATLAGMAHDSTNLTTSRQFLLDFLTWIGGSFVAVTASTILVVLIALTRWLLSGRLVSGQLPATGPTRAQARPGGQPESAGRSRSTRGLAAPMARDPARPSGVTGSGGTRTPGPARACGMTEAGVTRAPGPARACADDRDTWDRRPGGDPRDRRPRDSRDDRGPYGDEDPRDDRRSPSGPRDLWLRRDHSFSSGAYRRTRCLTPYSPPKSILASASWP